MCCFFSPPSTCLLNLAVCVYSPAKTKPTKQKPNLHARAREELLQLSNLTERKAGYLLTTFGWINVHTHTCTQTFTFVNKGAWSGAKASLASGGLQIFVLTCGLDSWRDRHQGSSPRALFLRGKQGQNRAVILLGVGKGLMSPLLARSLQKRTAVCKLISYTGYCERFVPDLLPKRQQPFHVLWCVSTVLVVEQYSIYSE